MNFKPVLTLTGLLFSAALFAQPADPTLIFAGEKNFKSIKQLTFKGENAEAYLSENDQQLIFQSANDTTPCDQIFTMTLDGKNVKKVSTGGGKTTCSYFIPGTNRIIYASTRGAGSACPPPPDYSKGYVWAIYDTFDLFTADADGKNVTQLTTSAGYDAEATLSFDGKKIVFTSTRNGDLDIYTMNVDGSELKQLTSALGYDGGPFFSHDGKKIIYRAYHPEGEKDQAEYKALLGENIIKPMNFEIWIMDADGSNKKQLTHAGMASFAPFFTPDDKNVIFSSNIGDPVKKRNFDLYMVDAEGKTEPRQITTSPGFDGFPMFTKDGKKLVFSSNRNNGGTRSTNVFVADWQD